MTRSLRELNRPGPIVYWSQGAHAGWEVFQFGPPREARLGFRLPRYIGNPVEVFRVDTDGIVAVEHRVRSGLLEIRDRASRVAVYLAAARQGERKDMQARHKALIAEEDSLGFDPGRNPADLEVLMQILGAAGKRPPGRWFAGTLGDLGLAPLRHHTTTEIRHNVHLVALQAPLSLPIHRVIARKACSFCGLLPSVLAGGWWGGRSGLAAIPVL